MSGTELYYIKGGAKKDAELHEPMLANPEAETLLWSVRATRLARMGLTPQEIGDSYG